MKRYKLMLWALSAMNRVVQIERFRSLTAAITIMCKVTVLVDRLMGKLRKICAMALSSLAARKALRSIRAILILNRQQS